MPMRSSASSPPLASMEHTLAECVHFLRALPGIAPHSDAALMLVSDAE